MLKAIEVSSMRDCYRNAYDNEMIYIGNLNKINIFIGENNSGKSRMLRYIVNGTDTKALSNIKSEENKKNYDDAKRRMLNSIKNFNQYDSIKINIPEEYKKFDDCNYFVAISEYIESIKIDKNNLNPNQKSCFSNILLFLNEMYKYLSRKEGYISKRINEYDITYIPILRGAESFNIYYQLNNNEDLKSIALTDRQLKAMNEYKQNAKHMYSNKVNRAYAINEKNIFTAEDLFDDVKNKLLGEEEDRNFIRDFEKFISKEFYDEKGFTIIPKINKGVLYVKIGNGQERALHNLGDGIKQLITIFYKLFEKRNKEAIFCIEEPEINLHPGYQRQFLQILEKNNCFSRHQFFITTHSNHFIDSCFDYNNISIYKFINVEKNNNLFKVINTNNKDIEILDLLGVHNSSVFISNCTIWVEGISDKILISKYLEIYLKSINEYSYKEDINYSFIEYGGNNIEHWAFIDEKDIETINASGITNRCFIICDNDNDGKKERKEKLKKAFGIERFYELKVREIENTISRKVLEKTLFNGGEPIITKAYKGESYATKSIYMGDFIDTHYDLGKKYSIKKDPEQKGSGTIREKLSFSKSIIQNINDVTDLSENAKELCEKIYNFIKKSNTR